MNYADIEKTCDRTRKNVDEISRMVHRALVVEKTCDKVVAVALATVLTSGAILTTSFALVSTIRVWMGLICG